MSVQTIQESRPAVGVMPSDLRLRRRLLTELSRIEDSFNRTTEPDFMRESLMEWITPFQRALAEGIDEERILTAAKESLRRILTDPFTNELFKANALLGSDGRTYDPVVLDNYRNSVVNEEFRDRSPMDPSNATPFTTRVHPHVGRMLEWLTTHDDPAFFQDRRRAYREAIMSEEHPSSSASSGQADQALLDRMLNYATQSVQGVIVEGSTLRAQRAAEIQDEGQRAQVVCAQVERELETVEEEYRVLEHEEDQITRRLQNTEVAISEIDQRRLRVAAAIKEIEKVPPKKKKKFLNELLKAVAIVGACWLASLAIGQIIAGMSGAATGVTGTAAAGAGGATASTSAASSHSLYFAPTRGGGAGLQYKGKWW